MFNRGNDNLLLHFAKTSKSQQVALFPWISTDWTSITITPGTIFGNQVVGNMLGSQWFDDFGNTFMLKSVRGTGGCSLGNALEWCYPGITIAAGGYTPTGTDTATAASTTTVVTATTGGFTAGQEVNNWLFCLNIGNGTTGSTKTDVIKLIKANTANTFVVSQLSTKYGNLQADPDAYVTAPANTNNLNVIRPFETTIFQFADAAKNLPVGIAVQNVAVNTYGFTQVSGLCVVTASATTLITAGQGVISDAAVAGQSKGGGAAITATSYGIGAAVGTATSNALVPIWLTLMPFA